MWQREAERADVAGQTVTPRGTGSFTDMLATGQTDSQTHDRFVKKGKVFWIIYDNPDS